MIGGRCWGSTVRAAAPPPPRPPCNFSDARPPQNCAGGSIIGDFSLQMLLSIPISAFWAWMITTYNFDWQDGMGGATFGVGTAFLLTMRVQTAYARYWEARGHIGTSIKCCRTTGILVVTQFHRHYGQPGSEVPKCVDDIRRYMMLYFYTMMLQVQGKSLNNSRLEQYLTQPELNLLQGRKNAAVVCVKWIASRLAHLESLGYMSPLQLHETNDALDGMIDAFNGLTKIKGTPIPFPIRQLCNILNTVYCYTIPLVFASKFASTYNEQLNIIGRTCLSAALISFAFFGITTTRMASRPLPTPASSPHRAPRPLAPGARGPARRRRQRPPLMKFATGLHTELLTLFSDEIPPLVGQVGELTPAVPNGNGGNRPRRRSRASSAPRRAATRASRRTCRAPASSSSRTAAASRSASDAGDGSRSGGIKGVMGYRGCVAALSSSPKLLENPVYSLMMRDDKQAPVHSPLSHPSWTVRRLFQETTQPPPALRPARGFLPFSTATSCAVLPSLLTTLTSTPAAPSSASMHLSWPKRAASWSAVSPL